MDDLFARADYISLHMPSTPENRQFVNAERLAYLPPRAWLINTARGALVEHGALVDALAQRAAAAAPDVMRSGGRSLRVAWVAPYDLRLLAHHIEGLEGPWPHGISIFHAGIDRRGDRWVTTGGRVVGVTARCETLERAREAAYGAVARIGFPGMRFRHDIAADAVGAGGATS